MALLYIDDFENGAVGVNLDSEPNRARFDVAVINGYRDVYARIVAGSLSNKHVLVFPSNSGGGVGYSCFFRPSRMVFNQKKIVVGFAFRLERLTPNGSYMATFSDNSSSRLVLNSDWSISVGNARTEANVLVSNVFSYMEVEIDYATGEFSLYINNLHIINGTMTFSGEKAIWLGCSGAGGSYVYFDDIYILDDTGTTHNQRLGPVRALRVPFNSTTEANFTPFGAADNITAINKDSPNDSTFNRSPANNNVGDYFKLDTSVLPSDRPIIAVQQSAMYRKTDIGERALKLVAKEGTDRKEHLLPERLATFSGGPAQILETSADGSDWDLTNLAATDFGYEAS